MSQLPPRSSGQPIDAKTSTVSRLRRLSYLLDNSISLPGTPFRIGLDPIIGLLPGVGDLLGTALSVYIVVEAARLGLPRNTLVQMVLNILFETVAGSVPLVGDLVDAAWKANARNMALLEEQLDVPQSNQESDWSFLALLLGGLFLIMLVAVGISIMLFLWLLKGISS